MITLDNLSASVLETYQATRKAMYLVLARMHDMGMNPDIEKAQNNEVLSVNTFMLGQAFIGNDPKLKEKNPIENVAAIEETYRTVLSKVPLDEEIVKFMTNESQLAFLLFLSGGAKVWFENNTSEQ